MTKSFPLFFSANSPNSSGISSDFIVDISSTPLELKQGMLIALKTALITNSWYTISQAIGNNTFHYLNASGVQRLVTIPDSQKNVLEINSILFQRMVELGDHVNEPPASISFNTDISTGKVITSISNGFKLDLQTSPGFAQLIGYQTNLFDVSLAGFFRADLGNGITGLLVSCSLADGLFVNLVSSRSMAQVPITSGPSRVLIYSPSQLTYMPVQKDIHTHVRITVTDNLGRGAPNFQLNGEEVSIELVLLMP